jgi:DNA-binding winged helix-turn-helix (wHTH) protein/tetratricopeptide (TPR) repeat protein
MTTGLLQFEDFSLDRGAYELRRNGQIVPLQRLPLELLFLLVEHRGQLVSREEILQRIWGKGVFVDVDNAINTAVRKLRRALDDDPESPRFVVTVPAKGYRFVSPIKEAEAETNQNSLPYLMSDSLRSVFVGREREMDDLRGGLEEANSGHGRLMLIAGSPGVGKTRLSTELAKLANGRDMVVLVGHCSEQDDAVPYLPFVEVLETGVDRAHGPEELHALLKDQGPELSRILPKLKRLAPDLAPAELSPEQARRHVFGSYYDFIARMARKKPTLLIVEDLHWADAGTLSLLLYLANRISDLPLALIGTHRDAEADISGDLAATLENLVRGRAALRINLKGLAVSQVGDMVKALSGKEPPSAVVREIYAETNGNPFFIEELLRYLEDENRLYDSAGRFRAQLKIGELDSPPSIRMIVGRRLARLSEPARKCLSTAATMGRTFGFQVLRAACGDDLDSLIAAVAEAERAGLICPTTGTGQTRFEFPHELIRQALLSSISAPLREQLHLQVGAAIEEVYPDRLDEHAIELARHYVLGDSPLKAARYCLRACNLCMERASFAEAVTHFETGLEMIPRLPDDSSRAALELDLRIAAHHALCVIKGSGSVQVEQSAARAIELCQQPGIDWEKSWLALAGVMRPLMVRDFHKAREVAAELVRRAELHGIAPYLVPALFSWAFANTLSGVFDVAAEAYERAIEIYRSLPKETTNPLLASFHASTQAASAWNRWFMGYPDRALERMKDAIACESSSKNTLVQLRHFELLFYHLCRDTERELETGEASLALATESEDIFRGAFAGVFLGWSDAMAGNLDSGIARMRHNLTEFRATGAETDTEYFLALIGTALGRKGAFEEGLHAINEAFLVMDRTGERCYEPEIHRLKGELLLAQNPSNAIQAAKSFHTAIEISRTQKARSWELRATMSLARLRAKQGKRGEVAAMLADIYRWFTEGFHTADLKEAKALLDSLKA